MRAPASCSNPAELCLRSAPGIKGRHILNLYAPLLAPLNRWRHHLFAAGRETGAHDADICPRLSQRLQQCADSDPVSLLPPRLSPPCTCKRGEAGCGLFWKWNREIRGRCKVWTGALPHTELLTGARLRSPAPECDFTVWFLCGALLEFPATLFLFLTLQIYP